MKPSPILGQLRERPSQCEIGDWITASSRPEWNSLGSIASYSSTRSGVTDLSFALEPYVNGKRVTVWVRVK